MCTVPCELRAGDTRRGCRLLVVGGLGSADAWKNRSRVLWPEHSRYWRHGRRGPGRGDPGDAPLAASKAGGGHAMSAEAPESAGFSMATGRL